MRMPPAHPFNPLRLLRLAIAFDSEPAACLVLFRFVFRDGHAPDDESAWHRLATELGVDDVDERISRPEVKEALRRNGQEAAARGVFGVPTLAVDQELFWGADATEMCRDYLTHDALFSDPEMQRAGALPEGAQRPR
jgi:2-hydroxychromene-2-carboxylate isomerase